VGEGVAGAGWQCVFGGGGVAAGADLDGAVAAGGADEFLDEPAGAAPGEPRDGQGGEHDDQVGPDGAALAAHSVNQQVTALRLSRSRSSNRSQDCDVHHSDLRLWSQAFP